MTRYRLSPEAESDLDEIKRYLTEQSSVGVARYVLREIRLALRSLRPLQVQDTSARTSPTSR